MFEAQPKSADFFFGRDDILLLLVHQIDRGNKILLTENVLPWPITIKILQVK